MKNKIIVLMIVCIGITTPVFGQTRVNLSCNIYSSAGSEIECNNGGFPYTVPAGKWLCITDMLLINKYPFNPPTCGPDMHTMYFYLYGITIAAHHPQVSLNTPFVYGPGTVYRGWIANGMCEDQYVYGIVTGRLWPNADCK